jgi:hypothetical protein
MHIPNQTGEHTPFKVIIKPRSQAHADLIRKECKATADELAAIEAAAATPLKATL